MQMRKLKSFLLEIKAISKASVKFQRQKVKDMLMSKVSNEVGETVLS